MTGFSEFTPSEAGYDELRRFFDYLLDIGQIGRSVAGRRPLVGNGVPNGVDGRTNGTEDKVDICVVDADDLLDNPKGIIEAYCKAVGIEYSPSMLKWDSDEDRRVAEQAFVKWKGFHEDAIHSTELRPRLNVSGSNESLHFSRCLELSFILNMACRRNLPNLTSSFTKNGSRSSDEKGRMS